MTPQCPEHPRTLGATLGHCPACEQEAARADHAAGAAAVRAALNAAPRPPAPADPDPTRQRALARARHQETQP